MKKSINKKVKVHSSKDPTKTESSNRPAIDSKHNIVITNSIGELNDLLYTLKSKLIPRHELLIILNKVVDNLETLIDNTRDNGDEQNKNSLDDHFTQELQEWIQVTFTEDSENQSKQQIVADTAKFRETHVIDDPELKSFETNIPEKALQHLKNDQMWGFNVFKFNDASEGHGLKYALFHYLNHYQLFHVFKIPLKTFDCLMNHIEYGYERFNNSYHNSIHATDALQTSHTLLHLTGIVSRLTFIELFTVLVSATIHDYEHQGVTNSFIINNKYHLSLTYNDISVQENHHVSAFFKLIRKPSVNITSNMTKDEFSTFRGLCTKMILATDMNKHFTMLNQFNTHLKNGEPVEKVDYLMLLIHAADLSNPAKEWKLSIQWVVHLFNEYFSQGDKEKQLGLPVSPLCDRKSTQVPESQIGFIEVIIYPTFELFSNFTETFVAHERSKLPKSRQIQTKNTGFQIKMQYKYCVKRPWEQEIMQNKVNWRRRGDKDYQDAKTNLDTHEINQNLSGETSM